ncbi:hypothetical protein M378DRAFT_183602 [Amanita muscaria Koide BX008]|uniref:Disintegrin and metalloproteinase domain-containing protein B n=1 Tax=Amanita muscaria (strain Koide BX008) TaxID=946122 RepID=A0A0C2XPI4_AMAMK|nr:hypothetical protein M378DRAFT_183602 [Amanita muscaria Koide BX008]
MSLQFSLLSVLAVAVLIFRPIYVSAHSLQARPIKRLAQPSTVSLEIVQKYTTNSENKRSSYTDHTSLRHDDSFRLVLSAFNDTFHLHLRPNDHLIHPAAQIIYYESSTDGAVQKHTAPLLRETVKAYWGEVVAAHHSPTRMLEDAIGVVHSPSHPADLGFARIMVHDHVNSGSSSISPNYEGAFSMNGDVYHIMTKDNYLRRKHRLDPELSAPTLGASSNLIIWRESDVMTAAEEFFALHGKQPQEEALEAGSCGHDRLAYNTLDLNPLMRTLRPTNVDPFWGILRSRGLYGRDDVAGSNAMGTNFANTIGVSTGCPTSQKVIYMGVAADCEYVTKYGSQDSARQAILGNWNAASALYKSTFNVSLGIIELQVQSPTCPSQPDPAIPWNTPCSSSVLDDRLSTFSQWRGQKGQDGAGLWHLMSGCPTGTEVGIAWLATLCRTQATSGGSNQTVSGTAVSTSGRTEWQVVAHEIGHNFGAICASGCTNSDQCCSLSTSTCDANSRFIMSPVSQSTEMTFSSCTLGNICSLMISGSQLNASCLVDPSPNKQIISLQMCGNGIVEQGEDCDPGQDTSSNCCDSTTCKFKSGAVCDPGSSPCCTSQCSFAPPTQVCRPSKDANCDSAETCTGNSSACPADQTAPNGKSCGSGLACASGLCTSPSLQCQSIGGSMGYNTSCPNRGDTSCQVSCQDPKNSNTCVLLGTLLVDGSPCGYGGMCSSGNCQSGSVLDTVKAWYMANLQIAIPVTVVVGIVVLLLLWGLGRVVVSCCRGKRYTAIKARELHHERLASHDTGYSRQNLHHLTPRAG